MADSIIVVPLSSINLHAYAVSIPINVPAGSVQRHGRAPSIPINVPRARRNLTGVNFSIPQVAIPIPKATMQRHVNTVIVQHFSLNTVKATIVVPPYSRTFIVTRET